MAQSPNKLKETLENAIRSSSDVGAGNYVSVAVSKKGLFGSGGLEVTLTGRCKSEKAKETVQKLVEETAEGASVVNKLRIGGTS
ncbi:MAG: BON domain-containing protein [bacterium]